MPDPVLPVAATVLGAMVGSFLNVVIHRLPRPEMDLLGLRSICPSCRKTIPAYLNVPIVSWLVLRGRTRCCGQKLSARYPTVEALTAVAFLSLVEWPPSGQVLTTDPTFLAVLAFALHAAFVSNLIASTFIDIDFRILPDLLTKPLMVLGLLGSLLVPGVAGPGLTGFFSVLSDMAPAAGSFLYSLVGLVVGFGLTWAVRATARFAFRREAMGFGDVKLMGGVGAFLGWDGALMTFFLGCVAGAIGGAVHKWLTRDSYLAFGPYLALGAVTTLFFGPSIKTFVTVTWPRWQLESALSPWILAVAGLSSLFLLIHVVRRGRTH
jgi:leader peptidase (prepilin peptidase)/N-methyltransferase